MELDDDSGYGTWRWGRMVLDEELIKYLHTGSDMLWGNGGLWVRN